MKKIVIVLLLMIYCARTPCIKIEDFNFAVNDSLSIFKLNRNDKVFNEDQTLKLFIKSPKNNHIDKIDVWLKFINAPDSQQIILNQNIDIKLPKPQKYNDLIGYLKFNNLSGSNPVTASSQPFVIPMRPKIDSLYLDEDSYLSPQPKENRILVDTKFRGDENSIKNMQLLIMEKRDTLRLKVQRDPVTRNKYYIRKEDNNKTHYDKFEKNTIEKPYLQSIEIEYNHSNFAGKFYSKPEIYFLTPTDLFISNYEDTVRLRRLDETEPPIKSAQNVLNHLYPQQKNLQYRNDYEVYEFEFSTKFSRKLCSYEPYKIAPSYWFQNRPALIGELISTLKYSKIGIHEFKNIAFIIEGDAGSRPEPVTRNTKKINRASRFQFNEFYRLDGNKLEHQQVRYHNERLTTINKINNYLATMRACKVTDILINELKSKVNYRNRFFTTITQKYSERVVRFYIIEIRKME